MSLYEQRLIRPEHRTRIFDAAVPYGVAILLYLTESRARRLLWRLDEGRDFSTSIPDRVLRLSRGWRLCLLVADHPFVERGGIVIDDDAPSQPTVVAVARIRSSPRSTTTDDRVMVGKPFVILGGIPLSAATKSVIDLDSNAVALADTVALDLGSGFTTKIRDGLDGLVPGLGVIIDGLLPGDADTAPIGGEAGENLAFERDAVRMALSIVGLEVDIDAGWNGLAGNGYLDSLAYSPREEVLIAHDAVRFPGWQSLPGGDPDWIQFSDGARHLRIANVDATPLERRLGVDLLYHHVEADTFVLVQYKKMTKDAEGRSWYRPDAQLAEEIARMQRVDRDPEVNTNANAETWRLHPRACFLKLVVPPRTFDPTADRLLSGIYLPLAYLEELLKHDSTLGPKGGRRLGYDNVDRYITTGLFTDLVRQGWVGSRGVTTQALSLIVKTSLDRGRSVVVAEESGKVRGAIRRSGRRAGYLGADKL